MTTVSTEKPQTTPEYYADHHRALLVSRSRTEPGFLLRRAQTTLSPGVPSDVWLGFTQIATSQTENTTVAVPEQEFHEVGLFQTPAGPRSGPAPNPNPHAPNNAWGAHANDDYVKNAIMAMTGSRRSAVMGADEWKTHVADQIAVGLADLRASARAVGRQIGPAAASDDLSTTWATALGFMAFAGGVDYAAHAIKPYVSALSHVPERARWSAYADLLEHDVANGASWEIERPYLGVWRKFAGGQLVAHHEGRGDAWDLWYDAPRVDSSVWVARSGRGVGMRAGVANADEGSGLVTVGLVVLGGWALTRRRRKRRRK